MKIHLVPSPIVDMSCDAKESNVPGILFFEFQWTRKVDLPTLYQLQVGGFSYMEFNGEYIATKV